MNQEKLLQYQMLEQQMQVVSQNLQNVEQSLADVNSIVESLQDFGKLKKGDKILVSLSNGIFAEAKLENSKDLKVNIGRNVVVTKSVEKTAEMMQEQVKELQKYKEEILTYYNNLYSQLQKLQEELI
ncbi:MAG: prefoldin subunit alpha [Nanoarchaeota archaeon]|nr:prefoldin subunit alpha [Nanoarchaeota archaeon]MBU1269243.1 prefoldin subunit alpha [Nanoarchaeota archaeon]MBU1604929.1 prefoldin subunit alpha [Nanoarchaeota archaeon]MBU2443502.1 prefoldin subunit alpha [Nanoarchaeota archaeon]